MTDFKDPPPLFDEDDSRKDDDDIFASAVQSPIKEEMVSEVQHITSTSSHPLLDDESEFIQVQEEKKPITSDLNIFPVAGNKAKQDLFESVDDGLFDSQEEGSVRSSADFKPLSLNNEDAAAAQVREDDLVLGSDSNGGGLNNSLLCLDVSDSILKTEPFSNNSFESNSSNVNVTDSSISVKCVDKLTKPHFLSDTDTTEILLDDTAQEISLKDDDDEDDGNIYKSVNETPGHIKQDMTGASGLLSTIGTSYSKSQTYTASSFSSASIPTPAVVSHSTLPTTSLDPLEQAEKDGGDTFIEILISDPQKIGDGIGSYMSYKVTTKTNIPYFRKKHWSVTRRFSDFLGLHSKLVEKHLHSGVIIPPAPEKAAIATTKIKLGSDKNADSSSVEFIERRRAALERYMNRTAVHPKLRSDPDFREFLELDADLPKATSTSAISGAGVLRLFNKMGETVNKMTFKMDESDQWFEEKTQQIENLDNQLRKLHISLEGLVGYRRELANSTGSFSKSAAVLSSVEEHTALSRALHQLAEAMERIHTIHHSQADADFFHLSETTKDYVNIIGAVKEVFHERVKTFQTWQHALATLSKKRENKAKMELTGRIDKVEQANDEVKEWESKVERSEEEFNRISKSIKVEMEQFDVIRVVDFKDMLIKYLEALIASQLQIVKVWESFLPEAKAIA